MFQKRFRIDHRVFIEIEPLIGNALWGGVAWVSISLHLYGFLAATTVFKILNELTTIQHRQNLD